MEASTIENVPEEAFTNQSFWLCDLLHHVFCPRNVLPLRTHQDLERKIAALHAVDAQCLWKYWNIGHVICPPRVGRDLSIGEAFATF